MRLAIDLSKDHFGAFVPGMAWETTIEFAPAERAQFAAVLDSSTVRELAGYCRALELLLRTRPG